MVFNSVERILSAVSKDGFADEVGSVCEVVIAPE